jgi:hypothetical protein
MKYKLLLLAGALLVLVAIVLAQAVSVQRSGAFVSSDGTGNNGTWVALAGVGGQGTPTGRVNPVGIYYSNDGTGKDGTWLACGNNCFGGGPALAQSVTVTPGTWLGTPGATAACATAEGAVCTPKAGIIKTVAGSTTGGGLGVPIFTLAWTTPFVSDPVCQLQSMAMNASPAIGFGYYSVNTTGVKTGISFGMSSNNVVLSATNFWTYQCQD